MEQANAKTISFERYTVTVSVPMHQSLISLSIYSSLNQAVSKFTTLCKYSKNTEFRENYERARMVCKYAHACGGELQELQNAEGALRIVLSFSTIEMLNHFANTVGKAMEFVTKK